MNEMISRYVKMILIFLVILLSVTIVLNRQISKMTKDNTTQETNVEEKEGEALSNQPSEVEEIPDGASEEDAEMQASIKIAKHYENNGYTKFHSDDIEGAIAEYNKAFEMGDDEIKLTSLKHLATCYEKLNKPEEKVRAYERMSRYITDKFEKAALNEKIAKEYVALGDNHKAVAYYIENYNADKSLPNIVAVLEVLAKNEDYERIKYYIYPYLADNPQDKEVLNKYIELIKFK